MFLRTVASCKESYLCSRPNSGAVWRPEGIKIHKSTIGHTGRKKAELICATALVLRKGIDLSEFNTSSETRSQLWSSAPSTPQHSLISYTEGKTDCGQSWELGQEGWKTVLLIISIKAVGQGVFHGEWSRGWGPGSPEVWNLVVFLSLALVKFLWALEFYA